MPRVETKKKGAGAERTCTTCGRVIIKGERYHTWAFRHGGRYFACADHYPKRSQLTQSKLGEVYAAIEDQEANLGDIMTHEDAEAALAAVSEVVTQVADEYREAAEHFGGAGENADRADELEGWASELEGAAFDADIEEPEEFDEGQARIDLSQELFGIDEPGELEDDQKKELDAAVAERKADTEAEHEEGQKEALTALRDEVQEYLNGCPL